LKGLLHIVQSLYCRVVVLGLDEIDNMHYLNGHFKLVDTFELERRLHILFPFVVEVIFCCFFFAVFTLEVYG